MPVTRRLSAILLAAAAGLSAQKFYPDDPLLAEPTPRDASHAVSRKLSDYYDFLQQTFSHPGEPARRGDATVRARAVNTLGEPMDGAWYTKRHYYHPMSTDELVQGPGNSRGPATDRKWTIVKAKTEGVTPGFEFKDSAGRRYPDFRTWRAFSVFVPENSFCFQRRHNEKRRKQAR